MFVLADFFGGFGQLVFGRRKLTAEDRAKIRCIAGLQTEMRGSVDNGSSSVVVASGPVEIDLMGDAAVARGIEGEPLAVRSSRHGRSERRQRTAQKHALRKKPMEGRVVSVRFPKYPGPTVRDWVNVICLLETCGQRPRGVWLRREDFPWLVTYAAMEVIADGEELFPPSPPVEYGRGGLKYSVGGSCWDLTWISEGTGEIHHLSKKVPRRRYGPGGVVIVIPPEEFIAVKQRTKKKLLLEARERGYLGDGEDTRHVESP